MCDDYDITVLQETWLLKQDLCILNIIHDNFLGCGISSVNCESDILIGRPYGGLAFMWQKNIAHKCKLVGYDDNRILGMRLNVCD